VKEPSLAVLSLEHFGRMVRIVAPPLFASKKQFLGSLAVAQDIVAASRQAMA
jgi:hypothetical protein